MFFIELLAEFNEPVKKELRELYNEANELLSIIVASIITSVQNIRNEKENKIRNRQSKI